jgi:hypothetical protein
MNLEQALEKFWRDKKRASPKPGSGKTSPIVPDYLGFQKWASDLLKFGQNQTFPHHHKHLNEKTQLTILFSDLHDAVEEAGIEISDGEIRLRENFGKWRESESPIKRFNKAKLLSFLLEDSGSRFRKVLAELQQKRNYSTQRDEPPRNAESTAHRVAFVEALAEGDKKNAYRLVGRLREEDHDEGEVDYFEALAAFMANEFRDAAMFAKRVNPRNIDWNQSYMIALESYAWLGDVDSLVFDIKKYGLDTLPPCFELYLGQIATRSSLSPELEFGKLANALVDSSRRIDPATGFFRIWNRYSCDLAVEWVERIKEEHLTQSAKLQSDPAVYSNIQALEHHAESDLSDIPLKTRQLSFALMWDQDLFQTIQKVPESEMSACIVQRLMRGSKEPVDFLLALKTQWRIGSKRDFVDNITRNIDGVVKIGSDLAWTLIGFGYQDSLVLSLHKEASLLRERLISNPSMAVKIQSMELNAEASKIDRKLSAMGQLAYRSAKWDLDALLESDFECRDAGMASLGFFRIIELEINYRIIFPVARKVEESDMFGAVDSMQVNSKNAERRRESWRKVCVDLKRAYERKGMELGAIEVFLNKVRGEKLDGIDKEIKQEFQNFIRPILTKHGWDAFQSGEIVADIAKEVREKFRNPPAHSRYLPISLARECKDHVDSALARLIRFTDVEGETT